MHQTTEPLEPLAQPEIATEPVASRVRTPTTHRQLSQRIIMAAMAGSLLVHLALAGSAWVYAILHPAPQLERFVEITLERPAPAKPRPAPPRARPRPRPKLITHHRPQPHPLRRIVPPPVHHPRPALRPVIKVHQPPPKPVIPPQSKPPVANKPAPAPTAPKPTTPLRNTAHNPAAPPSPGGQRKPKSRRRYTLNEPDATSDSPPAHNRPESQPSTSFDVHSNHNPRPHSNDDATGDTNDNGGENSGQPAGNPHRRESGYHARSHAASGMDASPGDPGSNAPAASGGPAPGPTTGNPGRHGNGGGRSTAGGADNPDAWEPSGSRRGSSEAPGADFHTPSPGNSGSPRRGNSEATANGDSADDSGPTPRHGTRRGQGRRMANREFDNIDPGVLPTPGHPRSGHHEGEGENNLPDERGGPVRQPHPTVPAELKQSGKREVTLSVLVEVNDQGQVTSATVQRSSGYPAMDESAVEACRDTPFKPKRRGGKTIASQYVVPFRIRIE